MQAGPGTPGPLPAAAAGVSLIKDAVRQLPAYSLAVRSCRRKLNQNESPFDLPDTVKRELAARAAALPWNRYPEFTPDALLRRLALLWGWEADGILTGNGSNELIQASLAVTVSAGDVVVAASPTFTLYRLITGVLGGRYVPVPLGFDFAFNVDRLIEAAGAERARVIVLNSPNNPTGSALPHGAIERLLAETDALLLVDEAYQDFGGHSALPLLRKSSRVVVLRTFSKAMGLAGLRFGALLAHPAVAREVAKAKLPYNVNVVTLAAAETVLDHLDARAELVRRIVAAREHAIERLRSLPGLTVIPSQANFFLIRLHEIAPADAFRRLLDEDGILVRDVSGHPELAGCLRITVGTEEDMDAVVAALSRLVGAPQPAGSHG